MHVKELKSTFCSKKTELDLKPAVSVLFSWLAQRQLRDCRKSSKAHAVLTVLREGHYQFPQSRSAPSSSLLRMTVIKLAEPCVYWFSISLHTDCHFPT